MQLEVKNLSCVRGEQLLIDGLSFVSRPGKLVHITGRNGSGKTSLLKLVCGLLEPESGEILWGDQDTRHNEQFNLDFIYIGHKDGLKDGLTAFENLSFYQKLICQPDESRLDDVLDRMDLLHCADRYTRKLSFGQRRRLAFGRLLLAHQPLWILDEPFTGIDTEGRKTLHQVCADHLERDGMIIMTNHGDLSASPMADRIRIVEL